MARNWSPVTTFSTGKPTSRQTFWVTSALSPVRILVVTPILARVSSALAADSLGGSKKAM